MEPEHVDALSAYLNKYDYTAGLRKRDWAWEFLRRNKEFQTEAYPGFGTVLSSIPGLDGITLLKMRFPQAAAEKWGLFFFPNPDVPAPGANTFWQPEFDPDHLEIKVTAREPGEVDTIYQRSVRTCQVKHLTDLRGVEHILLNGPTCTAQARCSGKSLITLEPVKMALAMRGSFDLEGHVQMHRRASIVFEPVPRRPLIWRGRANRLRNALICVDVKDAGFDLRHAAQIMFGEARIERDWSVSKSLRDRVRSYYRTGQRLRDGGYRNLLLKQAF
ncbi:MAG: hypothetical protein Hens3KO_13590 [Henriciella sp.]